MYLQPHPDLDLIENFLENYLSDREATITARKRELARLQARCQEKALRLEKLQKFSDDFFENRKRLNSLALTALDKAIALGDENIAEIALTIINKEYSKDFFGMMNKIGGLA